MAKRSAILCNDFIVMIYKSKMLHDMQLYADKIAIHGTEEIKG